MPSDDLRFSIDTIMKEEFDHDFEANQFRDHHQSKGTTFIDIDKAYRNWIRNSVKFGTAKTIGGQITRDRRPTAKKVDKRLVTSVESILGYTVNEISRTRFTDHGTDILVSGFKIEADSVEQVEQAIKAVLASMTPLSVEAIEPAGFVSYAGGQTFRRDTRRPLTTHEKPSNAVVRLSSRHCATCN